MPVQPLQTTLLRCHVNFVLPRTAATVTIGSARSLHFFGGVPVSINNLFGSSSCGNITGKFSIWKYTTCLLGVCIFGRGRGISRVMWLTTPGIRNINTAFKFKERKLQFSILFYLLYNFGLDCLVGLSLSASYQYILFIAIRKLCITVVRFQAKMKFHSEPKINLTYTDNYMLTVTQ